MNVVGKRSRLLGIAFLFQFATSIVSGVVLKPAWNVPGNISESMVKIASSPWLMRASILLDMLTALGIIFLGAMLFVTLRKQNGEAALVALGFYVLEAALLAVSRMEAFSLLRISQEYVTAGEPAFLETMGTLALESMDFAGVTLHMLAFCLGAILFYYLLDRARVVPRALSLWGLISVIPLLVGTILTMFGYEIPMYVYLPYIPFEFVVGVWILVKGAPEQAIVGR
jgi:hypothetical protein